MFLLPDSMFTAGNPLRDFFRSSWDFSPALFYGPARRTRESAMIRVDNPREILFKTLQSLGRVAPRSAAETVSPWKRFDKALAQVVRSQGYIRGRYRGVTLWLPAVPRNIQRKVLKRAESYNRVQIRFGQKSWEPSSLW